MSQSATRLIAPRHQRGIASILIIILIGLVLIVTVIGVFRTVRGAQEQTLAAHARIPAEATAWQGAEAIRRYLHNVDPKMLKYWIDNPPSAGTPIALDLTGEGAQDSSGAVNLEASIVKVEKELPLDADDTGYLATAMITGKAGAGRVAASAPIEVVYRFRVKNEEGPGGAIMGPIFKGLKLKGNPRFPPNTDLNVLGDVEMSEINSTGTVNVRDINATGGVVINSAVSIRNIHSNEDIVLTQGASATLIETPGAVTVSGDGSQGQIRAEGDVTFKWSRAQLVETGGNLVVGEPYPNSCPPSGSGLVDNTYIATAYVKKDVTWHSCGAGIELLFADGDLKRYHGASRRSDGVTYFTGTQHLRVRGSMDLHSAEATGRFTAKGAIRWDTKRIPANGPAHPQIGRMCSETSVSLLEPNNSWATGDIKGYAPVVTAFDPANNNDNLSATTPPGQCDFNMPLVAVPDVPEVSVEPPRVDANMLRTDANYEFALVGGAIQVTVRNVRSVPDGVYKLGWKLADESNPWSAKNGDYLCPADQLDATSASVEGQKKCLMANAKRLGEGLLYAGNTCFHTRAGSAGGPDTFIVGTFPNRNTSLPFPYGYENCNTIAHGIYFFNGDLEVGQKSFVATWIATGNIKTGGFHRTVAPNPAGFKATCQYDTNEPAMKDADGNTVTADTVDDTIPNSLCGPAALKENLVANAVMIAGQYLPDGSFSGGDITTIGTTKLEGIVIAGDKFTNRGQTTVTGNVIAAGQSGAPEMAGDFLNDFTLLPPTNDDFNKAPCMDEACKSNNAEVVWSRYR